MPFNSLPQKDFVNRESELDYLKCLADSHETHTVDNVLLEGARGMGKTELLKQLYGSLFWEGKHVVPFYYSFQRATLKVSHFVRDYFARFIRQYLAALTKNPAFIDSMGTPLAKLLPVMYGLKLDWMIELVEDFQTQVKSGDLYEQMLLAITAPVTAARTVGKPVLVMFDNFHMGMHLYEESQGDIPGLISLFEGSMKTSICPHIVTGSPEGVIESIFSDTALRGKVERVFISPLAENDAHSLFLSMLEKFRIKTDGKASLRFMRFLGGNPLYIRNMARAVHKTHKKSISENDLLECYSHEVSEGETAFYWSSVLREYFSDPHQKRAALELLMHSARASGLPADFEKLSLLLGIPSASLRAAWDSLYLAGIIGGQQQTSMKDNILEDVMQCLYAKEIGGERSEKIRDLIEGKYRSSGQGTTCFEMIIPMASDAELVAARAVEQIGKNIKIDPELINKIQLALIESCINAIEHSGSYDKKVFLKFLVSPGRLEISIESPGKFFDPELLESQTTEEKLKTDVKRGWGLKLMRTIMDEIKVERIGERTRLVLIKNIKPNEVLK